MWKLEISSDNVESSEYENVRFRSQSSRDFVTNAAERRETILSAASFDEEGAEKFIGRMILGSILSTETGFTADGILVKLDNTDRQRKHFVHIYHQTWNFELMVEAEVTEEH